MFSDMQWCVVNAFLIGNVPGRREGIQVLSQCCRVTQGSVAFCIIALALTLQVVRADTGRFISQREKGKLALVSQALCMQPSR